MNIMTAVFDTLQYAKKLREAGFTEQQAEVQAEAMAELVDDKLATKQDIFALKRDIEELRAELKRDMKELEYRLTIKMGSFLIIGLTALVTLMKLFHL
jgi:hypothetical protein